MTGFDQSDQERLRQLDERIAAQTDKPAAPDASEQRASRAGYELLGAVLAGLGLGYLADQQLETSPVGAVVGLFLGFGAGVFNAWRAAQGVEQAVGMRPVEPDATAATEDVKKDN